MLAILMWILAGVAAAAAMFYTYVWLERKLRLRHNKKIADEFLRRQFPQK